jgi:hypothetical protein
VARSLIESRRQVAKNLDAQVRRNTETILEDHPYWAKVADRQALRGIPALSRHGGSSAIAGTQPGDGLFDD